MKYGLKDKTIGSIVRVLASFPEIEEAILYGSRAMNSFKPGSDIDITLKGDQLDTILLNKINLALDELYLPNKIDLSIYHYIDHPDLLDHILRIGKLIYRKP
jgi:predicted nucleotidyltransferase